jgi:hypothetical protein
MKARPVAWRTRGRRSRIFWPCVSPWTGSPEGQGSPDRERGLRKSLVSPTTRHPLLLALPREGYEGVEGLLSGLVVAVEAIA